MNPRALTLTALLVVLVSALAGGIYLVTGDDGTTRPSAGRPNPAASGSQLATPAGKIGAQGLSIAEARSAETPENLLVRGFLVTQADGLVLCEELEAGTCHGDRLTVAGEPGIAPDGPEAVNLLGTIEGDTLAAVNLAAA